MLTPHFSAETAKRCLDLVSRLTGAEVAEAAEVVTRQRNLSIVLGCIAEKLAGPRAVKLLTEDTLDYLVTSLDPENHNTLPPTPVDPICIPIKLVLRTI